MPKPSRQRAPSPPPSPSAESGADSSPASAPASHSDSPPAFIADLGPEFDPERAAEESAPERPAEPQPPTPLVEWEQDTIEALLRLKGRALHAGIGVAEEDWRYTELDLAAIAPPLTRIANRYEPIQRLAKHADPLILAFALGGYGVRSLEERAAVLRDLEPDYEAEAVEEPVAAPAPPTPQTAARQTQPGPVQPPPAPASPPPPRPPRPAEAAIDPTKLEWEL